MYQSERSSTGRGAAHQTKLSRDSQGSCEAQCWEAQEWCPHLASTCRAPRITSRIAVYRRRKEIHDLPRVQLAGRWRGSRVTPLTRLKRAPPVERVNDYEWQQQEAAWMRWERTHRAERLPTVEQNKRRLHRQGDIVLHALAYQDGLIHLLLWLGCETFGEKACCGWLAGSSFRANEREERRWRLSRRQSSAVGEEAWAGCVHPKGLCPSGRPGLAFGDSGPGMIWTRHEAFGERSVSVRWRCVDETRINPNRSALNG